MLAYLASSCLLLMTLMIAFSYQQSTVDRNLRIDCYPDPSTVNQITCQSRGCIWDPNFDQSHPTVPLCYFPPGTGYALGPTGLANPYELVKYPTSPPNPFDADISPITVYHSSMGATLRVKIGVSGR
jgi:hypothetical protein